MLNIKYRRSLWVYLLNNLYTLSQRIRHRFEYSILSDILNCHSWSFDTLLAKAVRGFPKGIDFVSGFCKLILVIFAFKLLKSFSKQTLLADVILVWTEVDVVNGL